MLPCHNNLLRTIEYECPHFWFINCARRPAAAAASDWAYAWLARIHSPRKLFPRNFANGQSAKILSLENLALYGIQQLGRDTEVVKIDIIIILPPTTAVEDTEHHTSGLLPQLTALSALCTTFFSVHTSVLSCMFPAYTVMYLSSLLPHLPFWKVDFNFQCSYHCNAGTSSIPLRFHLYCMSLYNTVTMKIPYNTILYMALGILFTCTF